MAGWWGGALALEAGQAALEQPLALRQLAAQQLDVGQLQPRVRQVELAVRPRRLSAVLQRLVQAPRVPEDLRQARVHESGREGETLPRQRELGARAGLCRAVVALRALDLRQGLQTAALHPAAALQSARQNPRGHRRFAPDDTNMPIQGSHRASQ